MLTRRTGLTTVNLLVECGDISSPLDAISAISSARRLTAVAIGDGAVDRLAERVADEEGREGELHLGGGCAIDAFQQGQGREVISMDSGAKACSLPIKTRISSWHRRVRWA
jgi:hypothetical protein